VRLVLLVLLLLAPGLAWGQNAQRIPTCGTGQPPAGNGPLYMDQYGNLCVGGGNTSSAIQGFGNLTGNSASALLSSLTLGPNSAAWPASPGEVYIIATGGTGYVCPLGGTCSASVGIPIGGIVAGWGFYKPSTSMTVYATNAVTFTTQW
jgi:hypothetical protein